ncbi:MAG: hypothetical protein AAGA93_09970 [Actinomycetota bacterium]
MRSLDEVGEFAVGLPGVVEGTAYGNRAWRAGTKLFVWERPLRTTDVESFGDDPVPADPIIGVRVDGLDEKDAILQGGHAGVFTTPHFDGHASLLVELAAAEPGMVEELVTDAWLCSASKRAVTAYLDAQGDAD